MVYINQKQSYWQQISKISGFVALEWLFDLVSMLIDQFRLQIVIVLDL